MVADTSGQKVRYLVLQLEQRASGDSGQGTCRWTNIKQNSLDKHQTKAKPWVLEAHGSGLHWRRIFLEPRGPNSMSRKCAEDVETSRLCVGRCQELYVEQIT